MYIKIFKNIKKAFLWLFLVLFLVNINRYVFDLWNNEGDLSVSTIHKVDTKEEDKPQKYSDAIFCKNDFIFFPILDRKFYLSEYTSVERFSKLELGAVQFQNIVFLHRYKLLPPYRKSFLNANRLVVGNVVCVGGKKFLVKNIHIIKSSNLATFLYGQLENGREDILLITCEDPLGRKRRIFRLKPTI